MGLIEFGRWTEAAELVLWREQPDEWGMVIASDPRFTVAVDRAVTIMPAHIHAELHRFVTITKEDLAKALARRRARQAEEVGGHFPVLISHLPITLDSVRRGQIFVRRSELDWLFFTRWRLPDGWLTPEEEPRALEIFHDPLAITMRRAVIARLWPDQPWMAE
ncbi:hypothetical protein KTN05_16975 [Paracoccus sp. Z118]|uniref:hypothetical protein n=1 Tax=Paracoccus sp. Z118 TaxID=2851017 RepID=UPI001C2CAE73|nr:hypothetical protein [Paracoccus sp. Z118]MBV0893490.1 hypothetical protein [Paracoccus sp. Z118]